MLSNIYMKLLGEIIQEFGVECHQYVVVAQLYLSLPSHSKEAVEVLRHCLDLIGHWIKANKLKLSLEKNRGPHGQEILNASTELSTHFEWGCLPPARTDVHIWKYPRLSRESGGSSN